MATKKTVAISFVMVFLVLDLAAEVARLIACQVAAPQSAAALCLAPARSGSLIWDKAFRLFEALEQPTPTTPAQGESPLQRLKQEPKL